MAKDLLEQLGDYRANKITDLSDTQVERLQKSLQELENLVIAEASKIDPKRGSLKLRTTVALELRPKLKKFIEETYLTAVQTNISEYDNASAWLIATFKKYPIPNEFKEITELDFIFALSVSPYPIVIAFSNFALGSSSLQNTAISQPALE